MADAVENVLQKIGGGSVPPLIARPDDTAPVEPTAVEPNDPTAPGPDGVPPLLARPTGDTSLPHSAEPENEDLFTSAMANGALAETSGDPVRNIMIKTAPQRARQMISEYSQGQHPELTEDDLIKLDRVASEGTTAGQRFWKMLSAPFVDHEATLKTIWNPDDKKPGLVQRTGSGLAGFGKEYYDALVTKTADKPWYERPWAAIENGLQFRKNLITGGAKGVVNLIPMVTGLGAGMENVVTDALGLDVAHGVNATQYQFEHALAKGEAKTEKFIGSDPESYASAFGENVAPLLVPLGGEAGAAETIAKAADRLVETGTRAAAKTGEITAKVAESPATHAIALTASGHPIAAVAALGGETIGKNILNKSRVLRALGVTIPDSPLKAVRDFLSDVAASPDGQTIMETAQQRLSNKLENLQAAAEDIATDSDVSMAQKMTPDGKEFLHPADALPDKASKTYRSYQEQMQDLLEKQRTVEKYVRLNQILSDGGKLMLSSGGNTLAAGLTGQVLADATAPPLDTERSAQGLGMGLALGAPFSGIAAMSGTRAMRASRLAKLGENALPEDHPDFAAHQEAMKTANPDVAKTVNMYAGLLQPHDVKVVALDDAGMAQRAQVGPDKVTPPGFYDQNGRTVYLNIDKMNRDAAGHEAGHAILGEALNETNRELFGKVIDAINSPDPKIAGPFKDFAQFYENARRRMDPNAKNLSPEQIRDEALAELARHIFQQYGPEGFYGGESGGQIIQRGIHSATDSLLNFLISGRRDRPEVLPGFNAPVVPGTRDALTDILFQTGKAAEQGKKIDSGTPGSQPSSGAAPQAPAPAPAGPTGGPAAPVATAGKVPVAAPQDAVDALQSMGWKKTMAKQMADAAANELGQGANTEDIVALAMKKKANPVPITETAPAAVPAPDMKKPDLSGLSAPQAPAPNIRVEPNELKTFQANPDVAPLEKPEGATLESTIKSAVSDPNVQTGDYRVVADRKLDADGNVTPGQQRVFTTKLLNPTDKQTPVEALVRQHLTPEQGENALIIQRAIESGEPIRVNHNSVETDEFRTTGKERAAELSDEDRNRVAVEKNLQPVSFYVSGDNVLVNARSIDKVLANASHVNEWLEANKDRPEVSKLIADEIPYHSVQELQSDLPKYYENQSHGYGGGGQKLEGMPAPDPDYTPHKLSDDKVQFLNLIQGESGKNYADVAAANRPVSYQGREASINPLRDKLDSLGFAVRDSNGAKEVLHTATETLRLDRINGVLGTGEVGLPRGRGAITKAGFMPDIQTDVPRGTSFEGLSISAGQPERNKRGFTNADDATPSGRSNVEDGGSAPATQAQTFTGTERPSAESAGTGSGAVNDVRGDVTTDTGPVEFKHWSSHAELDQLDPKYHGTGPAFGEEGKRKRYYPEIYQPRTYVGLPGYEREWHLGPNPHEYTGTIDRGLIYPLIEDPLDLYPKAWDIIRSGKTYAPLDKQAAITLYEKLIKDHGYFGFEDEDSGAAAMFHKLPTDGTHVDDAYFNKVAPGYARRAPEMMNLLHDLNINAASLPEDYFAQKPANKAQVTKQNGIAKAYDGLKLDNLDDPNVERAYGSLVDKLKDQYGALADSGITVEPWTKDGQPYATSAELQNDLRQNNHIYYFATDPESFGSRGKEGFTDRNPMLQDSGLKASDGSALLNNDVLRIVHDAIAHGAYGVQFGPHGEEAAWRAHVATINDPWARWALTTETRGQNSWVNYRDSMLGKDGTPLKKGDEGYVAPQDRPFADQKIDLLPAKYMLTGNKDVDKVANDPEFQQAAKLSKRSFMPDIEPIVSHVPIYGHGALDEAGNTFYRTWPKPDKATFTLEPGLHDSLQAMDLGHLTTPEARTLNFEKGLGDDDVKFPKFHDPLVIEGHDLSNGQRYDYANLDGGLWWDHDKWIKEAQGRGHDGIIVLSPDAIRKGLGNKDYSAARDVNKPEKAPWNWQHSEDAFHDLVRSNPDSIDWENQQNEYLPLDDQSLGDKPGVNTDRLMDRFNAGEVGHDDVRRIMQRDQLQFMPDREADQERDFSNLSKEPSKFGGNPAPNEGDPPWVHRYFELDRKEKEQGLTDAEERELYGPIWNQMIKEYGSNDAFFLSHGGKQYNARNLFDDAGGAMKASDFTPKLMPDVQADDLPKAVRDAIVTRGGITVNTDGDKPVAGFAFSPYKPFEKSIPLDQLTEEDVRAYINDNADRLANDGAHIGAWDNGDGHAVLDIAVVHPDKLDALVKARNADQLAIYDLANNKEISVNDGLQEYKPEEVESAQQRIAKDQGDAVDAARRDEGAVRGQNGGGDEEAGIAQEAAALGLTHIGDSPGKGYALHQFNDPITKSTIAVRSTDDPGTLQQRLLASREKFLNPDGLAFMPDSRDEAIQAAALRYPDGRVFTGAVHAMAMNDAMEHYFKEDPKTWVQKASDPEDGYVTNTGEFLTRAQAMQRAKEIGQLRDKDYKKVQQQLGADIIGYDPNNLEAVAFDRARKFMPDVWSGVLSETTPEERALVRDKQAKVIRKIISKLASIEESADVALKGADAKKWYGDSAAALTGFFGPDADRFTALLASLSPQVSVQQNFSNAMRVWDRWLQDGRPTDHDSVRNIISEELSAEGRDAGKMTAWVNNAVRSFSADDPSPDALTLSGPKVNSFFANLRDRVNEVTNDRWMGKYAFGTIEAFTKNRRRQRREGEFTEMKSNRYIALNAHIRSTAKYLTSLTGELWTPAETQAAIWSYVKAKEEGTAVADVPDFAKLIKEANEDKETASVGVEEPF